MAEPIACPACGRRMLLASAEIIVHLHQVSPTIIGFTYGSLKDWPILVGKDAPVLCNHTDCQWEGKVSDLINSCEHEWIDIRNTAVTSGEMCKHCGTLIAGNEHTEG